MKKTTVKKQLNGLQITPLDNTQIAKIKGGTNSLVFIVEDDIFAM